MCSAPSNKRYYLPVVPGQAQSDFNRALKMQGKEPVALTENQYLLNCNYKGTIQYVEKALESHAAFVLAGIPL